MKEEGQEGVIQDCVAFLETSEFIRLQEVDGAVRYVATRLGLACLAASLGPDESLKVFTELSKRLRLTARKGSSSIGVDSLRVGLRLNPVEWQQGLYTPS